MVAVSLQGKGNSYIFSVLEKKTPLPECSGFYMLIQSDDKYGIRNRKILAVGYSNNFKADQASIYQQTMDDTHIYLMPDFESPPACVLNDLKVFMQAPTTDENEKGQVNT